MVLNGPMIIVQHFYYIIIILYLHNTPMWVKESGKYKYKQTKHRKHRKLQFDHNIGYTK